MLGWLFRGKKRNESERKAAFAAPATPMAPILATLDAALRQHEAGRLAEAESLYRELLAADPDNIDALHFLGVLAHQRKEHAQAAEWISKALARRADNAPAHNNLGCALVAQGKLAEAVTSFQTALEFAPDYVDAHRNLGRAHQAQGNLAQAAASFGNALRLRPDSAATQSDLADILTRLGRLDEAVACCEAALQIQPGLFEAHFNLAIALRDLGRRVDAMAQAQKAIQLRPEFAQAHYLLGHLHGDDDRREESIRCFERAIALDPGHAEARWSRAMAELPSTYGVQDSPQLLRTAFAAELAKLESWFDTAPIADVSRSVGVQQPFRLAYQDENNRDLLQRYGNLCARLMASWQQQHHALSTASPRRVFNDTIRVGIVSGHFRDHSVWHAIVKGWLQHLDRKRFTLIGFNLGLAGDRETSRATSWSAHFEQGPKDLPQWLQAIQTREPDVLIYPEIGMEPMALKLASLRLARVQATTWGHPETSGLPTIDYFLSADGLEPAGAQAHYSEKLVLLPNLGTFFEQRGFEAAAAEPGNWSLHGDVPLLLCAGVPFKYAPQNDWMLVEIARRLGKCRLVFFTHHERNQSEKLRHRLSAAFGARGLNIGDFATFVPWLSKPHFYGMLTRATAYLDSVGFSGFNTALQAVECGLPIVALEGRFLRARLASGILKRMGIHDLVAASQEDYIALAVRLALDPGFRAGARERIEQRRAMMFEDIAPVRALEQFLVHATRKSTLSRRN